MIKVITFDFDNTIIFSENIKYQAWFDLTPDITHTYLKELLMSNTLNRKQIVHQLTQQFPFVSSNLLELYSLEINNKLQKKGLIPGFSSLIQQLKLYSLFINSLAPIFYIESLLGSYTSYFNGIYGDEDNKLNHFQTIQHLSQISPNEILFIGDSISDFKISQEFGCHFIGFFNPELLDYHIPFIDDWSFKNRNYILYYIENQNNRK